MQQQTDTYLRRHTNTHSRRQTDTQRRIPVPSAGEAR
jgi:hypothetical protein